jgi:hypothetical protein
MTCQLDRIRCGITATYARDPRQQEEYKDPAEFWIVPVCRVLWRIMSIVVAHSHNLPDPCCCERNHYDCQADQSALPAVPPAVIQDPLKTKSARDLSYDCDEG